MRGGPEGARRWGLVEFTPRVGEEIYRDGKWAADWTPEEGATAS
jgi:hypothetical protein